MRSLLCIVAACLILSLSASAAATMTIVESGGDVIITVSGGTLDLTDLTFASTGSVTGFVNPKFDLAGAGAGAFDSYTGVTAPGTLGTGGFTGADSTTGSYVGFGFSPVRLLVPSGYVSGATLGTSTATFTGATFASLGLTTGTHVYSWGSGATADTFTVTVGAVPEPSTWTLASLIGLGLLYRRRRLADAA